MTDQNSKIRLIRMIFGALLYYESIMDLSSTFRNSILNFATPYSIRQSEFRNVELRLLISDPKSPRILHFSQSCNFLHFGPLYWIYHFQFLIFELGFSSDSLMISAQKTREYQTIAIKFISVFYFTILNLWTPKTSEYQILYQSSNFLYLGQPYWIRHF